MTENTVQRFLLEDLDIRGAHVRLDSVWQELLAGRDYPEPVIELLGQMSVTTLLLASNLKQAGRLTVQLRGDGPISLLVIDCTAEFNVRCMAQHAKVINDGSLIALLGRGQLLLSLDSPSMRTPYQSIVPLLGETIAEVFEHYLTQSEQLASRFFIAASKTSAGGLFVQKMPGADARDGDGWTRIETLSASVKRDELLAVPGEQLLTRLFNEEIHKNGVRLYAAHAVTHSVPEDWEKIRNMLRTLGREEIYSVLTARGEIVIRDDLGNREYRFDKVAIDALFTNTPSTPPSVH